MSALSQADSVVLNVDHIVGYQHWLLSFSLFPFFPIVERVLRVRSPLAFFKKIWTLATGQRPIFTYPAGLSHSCPNTAAHT